MGEDSVTNEGEMVFQGYTNVWLYSVFTFSCSPSMYDATHSGMRGKSYLWTLGFPVTANTIISKFPIPTTVSPRVGMVVWRGGGVGQ